MNEYLSLISSTESRIFNKVDLQGFTGVNTLDEREQYVAEELFKKDVLQKIRKGADIGYKTYPQKRKL